MKIDAGISVLELKGVDLTGSNVVVLDILRATSTIVTALANGCRGVIPVAGMKDAVAEAERRWKEGLQCVLGGERGGVQPEGFGAGNSPLEYTGSAVAGKYLVLTTTNGTGTIRACHTEANVYIGCILNAGAVAQLVYCAQRDIFFACAGTKGKLSLEDSAAAGLIINKIIKLAEASPHLKSIELTDAATAMARLAAGYRENIGQCLYHSAHGQKLLQMGFERDIQWCGQVDYFDFVPKLNTEAGMVARHKY